MPRKDCSPAPKELLRRLSLLMQIHLLTNPNRLARRYGFSAEYVRRQWRDMPDGQLGEAIARLDKALQD